MDENAIYELKKEKKKYQDLREKLISIIDKLKESINDYSVACNLEKYFSINDSSADGGKILDSKNDIKTIISQVSNKVIPAIDEQIKKIKKKLEGSS